MYLFFFAVLFIVFQYANEKIIWEAQDKTIKGLSAIVLSTQHDEGVSHKEIYDEVFN